MLKKTQDPAIELGGVVSNDEVNARRWRLSQLGYVAESSLWMLVVNALAHEGWAGEGSPAPSPVERQRLHDEIFDLFETRLEPFAPIWVILVRFCWCFARRFRRGDGVKCVFLAYNSVERPDLMKWIIRSWM